MNLQLDDVATFVRVVELGTLSAAAREREVPVSQITRALSRLEAVCGVRLLHRTTHGLSLTDEGQGFLAHARRLLDTAAELQGDLADRKGGPSGWVRVSVSPIIAQAMIAPGLAGLYRRHPQLHLDIAADDRMADMAREGIDVAIRTGTPHSDTLVAREIGHLTRALYAAPAYIAEHGMPRVPEDLTRHRIVVNTVHASAHRWAIGTDRAAEEVVVRGHTRTDNTAVVAALVLNGVGIGRIIDLVAAPLVRSGALLPVLPGQILTPAFPVYAVMLQERQRLPKIRACVDYWAQWIAANVRESDQAGPLHPPPHAARRSVR